MHSGTELCKNSECKKLEELDIARNYRQDSMHEVGKELSTHKRSYDKTVASGCDYSENLREFEGVNDIPKGVNDIPKDVIDTFHSVVRKYFRGPLKPPFNEKARRAAGFSPEWYLPLTAKEVDST
eukprot:Gb_15345 [translate_table: standard]